MNHGRIYLVGHPGSQFLVPASRFLAEKYLPGFHVEFLNHTGPVNEWSAFLHKELSKTYRPLVMLSLDDYLLSSPIDMDVYNEALSRFMEDGVRCVKLFECSEQEHAEYPVTTQYTLWDRKYLLHMLKHTSDPWNFEMHGSWRFAQEGGLSIRLEKPALKYNTSSALSKRWEGVRLDGLSEEDSKEVQKLINEHAVQR